MPLRPVPSAPTPRPAWRSGRCGGGLGAGLAHPRVKPEIGDQLPSSSETGGCRRSRPETTPRRSRSRRARSSAGARRSSAKRRGRSAARPRRSLRRGTRCGAARPGTVSASSTGSSSSPSHLRPLTPNRSDTGGRALQPAHQHRVDLVLRARPRAHQLLTPREPAAHHPGQRSSGIHTASSSPAASNLASVRASSRSVFARA